MNGNPLALIVPEDQSPSFAALLNAPTCAASAAAVKSGTCSAVDPLKPVPPFISIQQVPCVRNGFVPETVPRRNRSVAATTVALSGTDDVSNDRNAMCSFSLPPTSPARSAALPVSVAFTIAPCPDLHAKPLSRPPSPRRKTKVPKRGPRKKQAAIGRDWTTKNFRPQSAIRSSG